MRVLVLSASYGSGHNMAALGVAAALEREGASVAVRDHFREFVHPRFEQVTRALYTWMLRRVPLAWAAAYELADRMAVDSALSFGATRVGLARLARHLADESPDAVVTVHATPAVVMSALVAEGRRVPPHTTVVTDFVAHAQWMAPRIDRYCVPASEVAHEFVARGIPAERVVVTGVPVRPEFDESVSQLEARLALGLRPDVPVVLAMAGSEGGLGRLGGVVEALGRLERPLQSVVVAGRDIRLAQRLARAARGRDIRVLSWASDVRRLMAAADLLVTKAGGMTLAEAIAAELPLVTYGSLPGQERRNERFATRAGIAFTARSPRELAATLDRALGDPAILDRLRRNIRRMRRACPARNVARTLLDLAAVPA
ncbi:MAG: glycosyltransferase [Candidatus Rokubacteria bacterium]|nr:glycosyltransferase [Candidatus Rokubacteria bacterium]